jgi:hypothetical protein
MPILTVGWIGPGHYHLDKKEVQKIVGDYLKEREDKAKKEETEKKKIAEEEGYKVGTDLKGSLRWAEDVNGFKYETTNKDFWVHVGGWFQYDSVWFNQSDITRRPDQLGNFQDGTYFRRTRLRIDGQAWEVIEWNFIPALEGVSSGVVGLDEMWAGITKIPILGTIRAGRHKVPQGLEGDQVSSSRAMIFLERSSITDAFFKLRARNLDGEQRFGSALDLVRHVLPGRTRCQWGGLRRWGVRCLRPLDLNKLTNLRTPSLLRVFFHSVCQGEHRNHHLTLGDDGG